jgi:hypothetical protein
MKTKRLLIGAPVAIAGAAGFTACLLAAFTGMRDVMQTDGGFCASGGPYVIAHQCSVGDVHLLTVGIVGGLLASACYAIGTAVLGMRGSSAGLLTWTALFGVLGWNFIDLSRHPGPNLQGSTSGWMTTGVVFWVMALGGLIGGLALAVSGLTSPRRPSPAAAAMRPLVRAAVAPGYPGLQPGPGEWQSDPAPVPGPVTDRPGRGGALATVTAWLVATVAGAGLGIALSSSLISILR